MPFYTYQCSDCGDETEKMQSHAEMKLDEKRLRCAKCEGKMFHRFLPSPIRTDTTFVASIDDGFAGDEWHRRRATARARAAGVSTAGKRFYPQLCAPGVADDPKAWVSDDNARADIARRCEDLNYAANGDIKVKQREPEKDPFDKPYRPAPDIVDNVVSNIVAEEHDGKISEKKLADLTEATSERLAGNQK